MQEERYTIPTQSEKKKETDEAIRQMITNNPDSSIKELHLIYKNWYRQNFPVNSLLSLREFRDIASILGQSPA